MVTDDVTVVAGRLLTARRPLDVFGRLDGDADTQMRVAQGIYRNLAMTTHPDHTDEPEAADAFRRLHDMWEMARKQIRAGTYGNDGAMSGTRIRSRRREYTILSMVGSGDITDVYDVDGAGRDAIIKIARNARNNDLLKNEADTLRHLHTEAREEFRAYLPTMIDSFALRDTQRNGRHANVLNRMDGLVPLPEVFAAYPDGVHPKDMAWMWRRLLVAVGIVHETGIVHGAILPSHVLIQPEQHGLVLIDWCYATKVGGKPVAIVPSHRDWYPNEATDGSPSTYETDISMAARCMIAVMGGDPVRALLPQTVPSAIRAHFRAATLDSVRKRSDDALELKDAFDEVIERLWGKRVFRPFVMPPRDEPNRCCLIDMAEREGTCPTCGQQWIVVNGRWQKKGT